MQIKYFLLTGILCAFGFSLASQTQPASVSGTVKNNAGESIPAATIKLQGSPHGAVSDLNGAYSIRNVKPGAYRITVSALSYRSQTKEIRLSAAENITINFNIVEAPNQIEAVTVMGRTTAQEVNRQAFNVTAVDAKKLYNNTLDISGALDRVAGIRVRESGGVGSNFNLSLNGFSGKHIRYFVDGIPIDNFGTSFQINNIPINLAERIEVYKGVVPMWLGSDALGGAINIVSGDRYSNYLDASYSFGSFNTHRSVLNTAVTTKKGFTVQINAFQNYSDNNYKVRFSANDGASGVFGEERTFRRFNDTYHNETVIANIGLVDKPFADKLLLGLTAGKNYKEIQTGARMISVFGHVHRRGNILMPTLKYQKADLIKGLDLTINGNYNFGYEQNIDTVNLRYDWYKGTTPTTNGERSNRTLAKYWNNNGLATATLNYRLNEEHSIALNNVFNTFNRKAKDELNPLSAENERRKTINKNILGLGYTYNVRDKWSTSFFGKYIHQHTVNGLDRAGQPPMNKIGYGAAVSYFFNPNLQLRTSYELTNRLADASETFGDLENLEGNPNLKPEKSDNFNLGINYSFALNKNHQFAVNANGIYRYSTNFIFTRLNQNQSRLILDNKSGVTTWGADAEIRYSYKNWLSAGSTLTYQFLRNLQKIEPEYSQTAISPTYLAQMPNIPYLFGNGDITLSFRDIGKKGNNLSVGYNLLYVHDFWLYWPIFGSKDDSKYVVPEQFAHDLNVVYSLSNGRYNLGIEAKNITDEILYDNFSLQKPSRAFYVNLRYFLHKNK